MDPQQWLDGFEAQIADLQRKSAELQENLAGATGRATSQDGSVTVSVAPSGALLELQLGPRATDLGPARLTALIMETVRKAQRVAAGRVVEAFAPLGGGTEAMELMTSYLPPDEDDDATEEPGAEFAVPDAPPEQPAPPAPPVHRPPAPPAPPAFPTQHAAPQPPPAPRPSRGPSPIEDDDDNHPW